MFYNTDPAADSAVASFVTLLAAVEALGKVKVKLQEAVKEKPLMFALLNGVGLWCGGSVLDIKIVTGK